MSVALIKTSWKESGYEGDLAFKDADGNIIMVVESSGRAVIFPTGSTLTVTDGISGAVALSTDVNDMAAAGTSTANALGSETTAAPIDHVHKIGAHDHSGATKGGQIDPATCFAADAFDNAACDTIFTTGSFAADAASRAFFANGIWQAAHLASDAVETLKIKDSNVTTAKLETGILSANVAGRGKVATDFFDATTLADKIADDAMANAFLLAKIAADAFDNALCDLIFDDAAFAADAPSRAMFADGIWTGAKLADDCLSADTTGRAKMADDFFNSATVEAKFEDNSIPSGKVNWSYGGVGDIVTIVPDASAATGSAAGVARIDHTHAIACAVPSGSHVPDCSNAEGSSNSFARADHVHALACDAPADGSLAVANAEGAGTTFARSNHVHKAILLDDVAFNFGTGSDVQILLSSANDIGGGGAEDLVIALSNNNHALHITDVGAKATDWNLANATHPTVYIHSDTTPLTDYMLLYHDGDDGIIDSMGGNLLLKDTGVELVSFSTTKSFFNEPGADIDFQISSNDVAAMFVLDGGLNVIGIGVAATANSFVGIAHPAKTLVAAEEFATVRVSPAGAITTADDTATYDYLATMYLAEPNITKGGTDTLTLAATLYIKDAPDEAVANYALYIASGAAGVQALTAAGLVTASGGIAMADQELDFTTGYIEFGTTPADAGEIRQENNVAIWSARNQGDDGNISGWKVNATDDYEAGADVNLAGNKLYGGTAANADLDLNATIHGTDATAYIIARQMIDATVGMIATLVKAGAVGDDECNQDDLNGQLAIDSSNHRIYFRYGDGWHYCTQDGGFSLPEYEKNCPVCGQPIVIGEADVGVILPRQVRQ